MSKLIEHSLTSLASMVRAREISPVEIVKAQLEQIEKLNPRLNAIVTLAPDLLAQARVAEEKPTDRPLHGVPVTVKDTFETAGLRSTSGSRTRAEYVPTRDAPTVALLRNAGAIILGKTNTAEMAMDY